MFQTLRQIAEEYHTSTECVGKILYALGVCDKNHPVKTLIPFDQYITHGIAQPATDSSGKVIYYRYNIGPIKEEFEEKLSECDPSSLQTEVSGSTVFSVENTLAKMLDTLNEVLGTGDFQVLHRLKADIADIYAHLPATTAKPKQKRIELDAEAKERLDRLRQWRSATAKRKEVPPHAVMTNAVLNAIAYCRPKNEEELLSIKGFGKKRAELYSGKILKLLY